MLASCSNCASFLKLPKRKADHWLDVVEKVDRCGRCVGRIVFSDKSDRVLAQALFDGIDKYEDRLRMDEVSLGIYNVQGQTV